MNILEIQWFFSPILTRRLNEKILKNRQILIRQCSEKSFLSWESKSIWQELFCQTSCGCAFSSRAVLLSGGRKTHWERWKSCSGANPFAARWHMRCEARLGNSVFFTGEFKWIINRLARRVVAYEQSRLFCNKLLLLQLARERVELFTFIASLFFDVLSYEWHRIIIGWNKWTWAWRVFVLRGFK